MSFHMTSPPRRASWLALLALLAVTALALHGPIVQWPGYHGFADTRAWASVPNVLNVLSNLPFAIAGLWAWPHLRNAGSAWQAFCAAIIATAFGSSVYHWHPDNLTLLVDRLPIAWACSALLCAFLAERVGASWQSPRVVACALAASTAAVAWWGIGTALGAGDLRPYALVQFLPMLLIPASLLLRMQPLHSGALPGAAWWAALGLYAGAKGMEGADAAVMEALNSMGGLSGHTLKHLLAAAAAALLLHARAGRGDQLR